MQTLLIGSGSWESKSILFIILEVTVILLNGETFGYCVKRYSKMPVATPTFKDSPIPILGIVIV